MQLHVNSHRLAAAASTLLCLAGSLQAGEGYTEAISRETVRFNGYSDSASEIYSTPSIRLDWNSRYRRSNGFFTTLPTTERTALRNNLLFSMGLWENLPSSRINFSLGIERTVSALDLSDGSNLTTIAETSLGGVCEGLLQNANSPELREFDVMLARDVNNLNPALSRARLTHELGHGLGFNHSRLNDDCTDLLTNVRSKPSVMSYDVSAVNGAAYPEIASDGLVQPEDFAIAARLYPALMGVVSPNNTPTLSRTTGSVTGRLVRSDGETEVYGVNVVLISRSGENNGRAVASRISGYAETIGGGAPDGSFTLDGVPPGSYELYAADWFDGILPLNNTTIESMQLVNGFSSYFQAQFGFAVSYQRTQVFSISVTAGETVDLGVVSESSQRLASQPDFVDVTDTWSGGTYFATFYWVYTNIDTGEQHGFVSTIGSNSARLPAGRYNLAKHRFVGTSYTFGGTTFRDYRPRRLELTWTRPVKYHSSTGFGSWSFPRYVEALDLRVAYRQSIAGAPWRFRYVNGTSYSTYVPGGTYSRYTRRRWDASSSYELHQGTSNVSTN